MFVDLNNKTLTIEKLNFTGKWIEFWFKEEKRYEDELDDNFEPTGNKLETWSASCKNHLIYTAARKAGIDENEINNHGYVGRVIKWNSDSSSFDFVIPEDRKNVCPVKIVAVDTNCASCTGCSFITICCNKINPKDHDMFKSFYTENMGVVECGNGIIFEIQVK